MASRTLLAALALLLGWSCTDELETCQPTRLEAQPVENGVLRARLTSGDMALRGRQVSFVVRDGDVVLADEHAEVARDGTATLELGERAGVLDRADRFTAIFSGDRAYCEARDTAPIQGG